MDEQNKSSQLLEEDNSHFENLYVDEMAGFLSPMESIEELTEKRIKKLESMIRSSFEYKNYISYIKEELDVTKCALLEGLDIKDVSGVSLELHHTPFTLYDIVEVVTKKLFDDAKVGGKVSNFDIAKQVMYEHYMGKVGLVPLSKTMHEAVHNNAVVVPASKIYGDYKGFIDKYKEFIPIDKLEAISNLLRYSETSASKNTTRNMLEIDAIRIESETDE